MAQWWLKFAEVVAQALAERWAKRHQEPQVRPSALSKPSCEKKCAKPQSVDNDHVTPESAPEARE